MKNRVHNFRDLTGRVFGKLTVVAYAGTVSSGKASWLCLCECGRQIEARSGNLISGKSASCGCSKRKLFTGKVFASSDGARKNPAYSCWYTMISRCEREDDPSYYLYGQRGIQVCQRWMDSFDDFLRDMGPRPSRKHTLDRYPNKDGNYEPGNVRWATAAQQSVNKRNTVTVTVGNVTMPAVWWCEKLGLNKNTVRSRLRRGYPPVKALEIQDSRAALAALGIEVGHEDAT